VANDTLCVGWLPVWTRGSRLLLAGILLRNCLGWSARNRGQSKAPRGRNGAICGSGAGADLLWGARDADESAVAQLDAHTYRGNRRGGWQRLPTRSLLSWHGVVENDQADLRGERAGVRKHAIRSGEWVVRSQAGDSLCCKQRCKLARQKNPPNQRASRRRALEHGDGTEVVVRDVRFRRKMRRGLR